ncbi:MAG: hypothetical protein ACO3JL_11120 [Myxococcota bacterium]
MPPIGSLLHLTALPAYDQAVMGHEDDDFFDDELEVVELDFDSRRAVIPTPARLFVFEPLGTEATEKLTSAGLSVQRATTGSEMMAAAKKGDLLGVIVSPSTDPELRELFLRAFRGRFDKVPVFILSERHNDPKELAQHRHEGASVTLPWPLPDSSSIISMLQAHLPTLLELAAHQKQTAAGHDDELRVLSRKVSALERQREAPAELGSELQRVRSLVEEREVEATSLRSELTLVRERSALLQDRIDRLVNDLAAVSHERDELKLRQALAVHEPATSGPSDELLASLRKIGDSTDSFVWGLEQAIQFFEELQFEAGDQRAPSLKGHIRSLQLVRALLERLRDRLRRL